MNASPQPQDIYAICVIVKGIPSVRPQCIPGRLNVINLTTALKVVRRPEIHV
jgi:hypothetical protein